MIISCERRKIILSLVVGFLLVLFVTSCFFIPKTDAAFSVSLCEHSGFVDPSEVFSIGLMLDDSYSFRAAAFEFEISEYVSLVDVSLAGEFESLGVELFWGERSNGIIFVHLGFVCAEPIPVVSNLFELELVANDSGYLRLVKAEAIDDDLKIEKGRVRDPLRVFVLGK